MDLYQSTGSSIPQRVVLIAVQTVILVITGWLLLGGVNDLNAWFGWRLGQNDGNRQIVMFLLFLIVYARITFMVCYLLRRSISWNETFAIPSAFALYYIGYPLFSLMSPTPVTRWDYVFVALFLFGSWISTFSEWQRNHWKRPPQNAGKLYTKGLFQFSMHINYFGEELWVTALALLTNNPWALLIPAFLLCMFVFYNIPMLDRHLEDHYREDFPMYKQKTKKLIPFIY